MDDLLIYPHQGLGDHIICNGLVRHFSENFSIKLFCKLHILPNISYMYRDNELIKLIPINDDTEGMSLLNGCDNIKLILGFHNREYSLDNTSFDKAFYTLAKINFNIRFDKFYTQRDEEKENSVYKILNPDDAPYIYVHDDKALNYVIAHTKHRQDMNIIYNDMRYNIFEMRKILENATEIHTMQTGMYDFCNSIDLACPIYVHLYVRNYPPSYLSKGRSSNKYILVR